MLRLIREATGRRPTVGRSLSMSLVAPGRVGPLIATPVFSAVDADTVGCRVELRDTGWDGCPMAAAFIRLQFY